MAAIDEQSPDEDDRIASNFLKAGDRKRKRNRVRHGMY
jgi:hypothetical protein